MAPEFARFSTLAARFSSGGHTTGIRIGCGSPQTLRKHRRSIPTSARSKRWSVIKGSGWPCVGNAIRRSADQHKRQLQTDEAHEKKGCQQRRLSEEPRHHNSGSHQHGGNQDGCQVVRHGVQSRNKINLTKKISVHEETSLLFLYQDKQFRVSLFGVMDSIELIDGFGSPRSTR